MYRFSQVVVGFALIAAFVSAAPPVTPYASQPCPTGWNYHDWDDSCNSVWPKSNRSAARLNNAPSLLTFAQATAFCGSHGAELPIIRDIPTQLTYYMNLALNNSGIKWWIGVSADKRFANNQTWVTSSGRPVGFVFNWDAARVQPKALDRCAVMHQVGLPASRVYGGNGFMISSDCYERHSVICTKQRVPVSITAINDGAPRQISLIYGFPLTISIMGHRIPDGTQVSLQSASARTAVPIPDRAPTHCKAILNMSGVAAPFVLNVSNTSVASSLCTRNTCAVGSFTIPADWPVVRGARYSLCFFTALPFSTPVSFREFEYELLGPAAYIEVFQHTPDYLSDVCTRRTQDMQVVSGDGVADNKLPPDTAPYFFDSRVEGTAYQSNLEGVRKPMTPPVQGW
jgi:hypothetical protein